MKSSPVAWRAGRPTHSALAHDLYRGGADTHFRLHGTVEPWLIGTNVSSGCIRLINQDIIDLYNRVPTGTKVIVTA